jgi:hypothetical protein
MSGDKELTRIENLAIPSAFVEYGEEETERERRKFCKLTF